MKKLIFACILLLGVTSCDQKNIKQTTDSIKSADSLITKATEGYKALDSISKIISDSSKFNSEIKNQTDAIRKKVNIDNLDSISDAINKMSKDITSNQDVVKTVDSASKAIQNAKNPTDAIATITKTIEKVSKKIPSKSERNQEPQTGENKDSYNGNSVNPSRENRSPYEGNPLIKKANIEITVENIETAKNNLNSTLSETGAEVISETFTDINGARRSSIGAKIPARDFEKGIAEISEKIGSVTAKNIDSEGKEYDSNQMYDVTITLIEDQKHTAQDVSPLSPPLPSEKSDTFSDQSSNAFKKGFSSFGTILISLIQFWPLLLIGGLIWYFVARSKKKKREEEFQRQMLLEKQRQETLQKQNELKEKALKEVTEKEEETKPKDDDYTRFMPKR